MSPSNPCFRPAKGVGSADVQLTGLTQASLHPHKKLAWRRLFATSGFVAILALTSCGEQAPPVDEWEVTWNNTVSTVEEASITDATQEDCDDILAYLRVQRTVVSPVPLEDLETPVDAWFSEAESIFFDCDLAGDAARRSLETLQALQGEVAAVLDLEG
jgi:hypothetical protein